jgi:hypothetical protein
MLTFVKAAADAGAAPEAGRDFADFWIFKGVSVKIRLSALVISRA